jgi:thioredoxin 1
MMAPILRDLAREYEGKAAVIFIDVWKSSASRQPLRVCAAETQVP